MGSVSWKVFAVRNVLRRRGIADHRAGRVVRPVGRAGDGVEVAVDLEGIAVDVDAAVRRWWDHLVDVDAECVGAYGGDAGVDVGARR